MHHAIEQMDVCTTNRSDSVTLKNNMFSTYSEFESDSKQNHRAVRCCDGLLEWSDHPSWDRGIDKPAWQRVNTYPFPTDYLDYGTLMAGPIEQVLMAYPILEGPMGTTFQRNRHYLDSESSESWAPLPFGHILQIQ